MRTVAARCTHPTSHLQRLRQMRRMHQMGYRALLVAFVMLIGLGCAIGPQSVMPARAASAPASGSIYFGLVYPGAPDVKRLQRYETELDHGMSLVLWYQDWAMGGKQQAFPVTQLDMARTHGSIPVLAWYPMDGAGPEPSQPEFSLARIINGSWDAYIRQYATQVKAWGHPFFLRFASEMNGSWTPWSEMSNGNQTGQFVRAWRHVHDIFTQVGVKNATWAWCPNIEDATTTPLEDLYPGSAYVDWACIDGYNFGPDLNGAPWHSFSQVFGGTYKHLLSLIPSHMPIMIGETGSSEHGGSKPNWITDGLAQQIPVHFPRIKGVIWFQSATTGIDLRFDTSPQSLKATIGALATGAYASNDYRFLGQSPIPVPGGVKTRTSTPPIFHDASSPDAGYVQVLGTAHKTPLSNATLSYANYAKRASPATDARGMVAMPKDTEEIALTAIRVTGGTLAISLPLDRRYGYQIDVDMQTGTVVSIHVHDPPPLPSQPASKAVSTLKDAPPLWLATLSLAALTVFVTFLLVMRLSLSRRRRLRKRLRDSAVRQDIHARQEAARHRNLWSEHDSW